MLRVCKVAVLVSVALLGSWSSLVAQIHGPAGAIPGTERWIVHFQRHYDRSMVRTAVVQSGDLSGVMGPDLDAAISRLETRIQIDRLGFVQDVATAKGTVTASWWLVDACAVEIPFALVATLRQRTDVAFLEPDLAAEATIRRATAPNNHAADLVHARGFRGKGVTVAIMDSGQDADMNGVGRPHQTYFQAGNLLKQQSGGIGGSRLILNRKFGVLPAEDAHGHGTAVAGVAVGASWNHIEADEGHAPDALLAGYAIGDYVQSGAVYSFYSTMVSAWQAIVADRVKHGIVAANLSFSGDPNPLNVAQQALDNAARLGDILITTSAGNTSASTASSPSAVNAIAVGAVTADSHVVASFSARGPIQGDPQRTYPDIVACGIDVYMPWADHESGWYRDSGTSMAAPQVSGAAALLRAAVPSLRAEETKAILLTAAMDISAKNATPPFNTKNAYGTGMLRDDLALDIANDFRAHGRASLTASSPTVELELEVRAGQSYAFGISWFRSDVTSIQWSNLDLEVLDAAGVLVRSQSPRNLYEVVRFTATRSGQYKLRVIATSLAQPQQVFGWAFTGQIVSADSRQFYSSRIGAQASSLGHSVSVLGDVDADDLPDFVTTAVVGLPNTGDFGVVRVISGSNGKILHSLGEKDTRAAFGFTAAGVGDINRDGVPDFAIGSPEVTAGRGEVQLFSGLDGSSLAVLQGKIGDAFGYSVGRVGDTDGDGVSDFLVGAPQGLTSPGYAVLYSGKTLAPLHTLVGPAAGLGFGSVCVTVGDIDADGSPDLAVGAPLAAGKGSVFLFSGRSGALIRSLNGRASDDRFGASITGGVDFDADGRVDVVVGAPRAKAVTGKGELEIFSGRTGASIRRLQGAVENGHFARSLCIVPDLDGDGKSDLAAGSVPESEGLRGYVSVFSHGQSLVQTIRGEINERCFGFALDAADLNGDGVGDLVIGAPALRPGAIAGGSAQAFRAQQVLAVDATYLSVAAGGVQSLAIDAAPPCAGAQYIIYGSATGFSPGMILAGLHIPLELDWYTVVTGMAANSAVMVNSLGALDGLGRAQSQYVVPANTSPALIGVELFHAAIILDVANGKLHTASIARPLRFEK